MDDVVLITADSIRYDYVGEMNFVSSMDPGVGVVGGHYTGPSLASLHSSDLKSAITSIVKTPTLAEVFKKAGYTCIGLAPNARTDPAFGFDKGFNYFDSYVKGSGGMLKDRRSSIREYLGKFDIVRDIYRRFYPMGSLMEDLPTDRELVEEAVERFNAADPPRFLWIHLMESHRPYGQGDNAIPKGLDRKAETCGRKSFFNSNLSEEEKEIVISAYKMALERVDDNIDYLVTNLDSDPLLAFCSDHGEELGEDGYYYHQAYRRRLVDTIVKVPVAFKGFDTIAENLSLLDIAPTLASAADVEVPKDWQGNDLNQEETKSTLTIAPWNDKASIMWQDFDRKIIAEDAEVTYLSEGELVRPEEKEVSEDLEKRLKDLGYLGAG